MRGGRGVYNVLDHTPIVHHVDVFDYLCVWVVWCVWVWVCVCERERERVCV